MSIDSIFPTPDLPEAPDTAPPPPEDDEQDLQALAIRRRRLEESRVTRQSLRIDPGLNTPGSPGLRIGGG